ncbi:MAG TPA: MFS transporter [Gammaproteobacteria bacterium]|nr:MFS transporter [Gammaproteobacteria bacterium]
MSYLKRYINKAAKIEANEIRAVLVSFAFIFSLLAAYYIIRSVRDGMSSDWSDAELSTIWTFTFFISFLVVSFYGYICSKVKFKYLVPGVYGFFAISFVLLFLLINFFPELNLINQIFYVWVSVFSLLNISVFWSFMADTYNKEQAKRLFAFIASGSSLGAIFGPTISLIFASRLGSNSLVLISAVMLIIPMMIAMYLNKIKAIDLDNASSSEFNENEMSGKFWDGFAELLKPPLAKNILLGIGIFIVLYSGISTFVYFAIKNILTDIDQDTRTEIWASIDLAVNVLGVFIAMFGTSRLAKRFGLSVTLSLVPGIIILGMFILALSPILWVVVGLQIVRRAGEYAITKPAREMLFTLVDRESRFKAKSVIDVVVYRAGDIFWAWGFTGLTQVLGLGLGAIAGIGGFVAILWTALALRLGRAFDAEVTE